MTTIQTLYFEQAAQTSASQLEGQTACIQLNAKVDVCSYDGIAHQFIIVSLQGTQVTATQSGSLAHNQSDLRGWFTESVDIKIDMNNKDFFRYQDSPGTTLGSESTSSSTGISISEQLGTFGPVPTTGVGGGLVIGSTFSRNLSDIKVVSTSTPTEIHHSYRMASSCGGAYEQPSDLINNTADGQFHGCPLFTLPDIVVSELPIISQGIFVSHNPKPGAVALQIHVTQRLRKVEKTFKVFSVDCSAASMLFNQNFVFPVV